MKNWLGWSYRDEKDKKQPTRFYREFDIAVFERQTQAGYHSLILTGFEIKGFEEKSGRTPSFAEGLEQALVYLYQGADFAYVVHPAPDRDDDRKALKGLCDNFAPHVGVVFLPHDLSKPDDIYWAVSLPFRQAQQNYHSNRDRKRTMLTSVSTGGMRDEIGELPLWCKRQEY